MTNSSAIEGARPLDSMMLVSEIICSYVSNNPVAASDLPGLIVSVRDVITGTAAAPAEPGVTKATPAQIKKSITHEALISFEDGKPYKTLRRHLTMKGLTPEGYRAKWGLPTDYPMTSAGYSDQRSKLALELGLGQVRKKGAAGGA